MTEMRDAQPQPKLLLDTLDEMIDRSPESSDARRALDLLRTHWAAVLGKDADGVRSTYSDDVVVELPFSESGRVEEGHFRSFRGLDEVMEFWATAFALEGDGLGVFDAEVHLTDSGNVAFIEGFGQITMTNGRDYRNRYVFRLTLADGKVTSCREYYNPIVSARAFGREIVSTQD